jgi:serine protease AprX
MGSRACWGWPVAILLVVCVVLVAASPAAAQRSKLSTDLAALPDSIPVKVIVGYGKPPGASDDAAATGVGAVKGKALGMKRHRHFIMSPRQARTLAARNPNVRFISLDRVVTALADPAILDYDYRTVNADIAWQYGYDGTGIGVAVIDSGIIDTPDLYNSSGSRVVYSQDFTGTGSTVDVYGHGSHVAGIIGGNGASSSGANYTYTFTGMAPNVNLINLRVLDQNGQGSDSNVIAAINQAVALQAQYNIRVINLSVGRPVFESYTQDPLCQAVEAAWQAGIVVVSAAGNEGRNNSANTNGYGTVIAPGNDPYVITVGAMKTMGTPDRSDDLIASYSSKGPTLYDHIVKPDVVAPGNRVISLYTPGTTLDTEFPGNEVPTSLYQTYGNTTPSPNYFSLSGTSMATPVVSGAVALLLHQNPALTPDQVKARLMKTAYKVFPSYSTATDPSTGVTYTSQYDIFTVGAGYLDVQAALASSDLASSTMGSAMSPAVAIDSNGNVYVVPSSSEVWGNSVMWGNSVVWGTAVMSGTNASGQSVLWGSSVCWGTSTDQGYGVVWGTSVMWGTSLTDNGEAAKAAAYGER